MRAGWIAANVLGWPALQLSISWVAVHIDPRHFARDRSFYRLRDWEMPCYRRWFRIRKWKHLLPDGGPWAGGDFRKKILAGRDRSYLARLVLETRRGEAAHWAMMACFPIFFFWNPPWACAVMALYAVAANLPCILVQRYNRGAVERLLARRAVRALPASR